MTVLSGSRCGTRRSVKVTCHRDPSFADSRLQLLAAVPTNCFLCPALTLQRNIRSTHAKTQKVKKINPQKLSLMSEIKSAIFLANCVKSIFNCYILPRNNWQQEYMKWIWKEYILSPKYLLLLLEGALIRETKFVVPKYVSLAWRLF